MMMENKRTLVFKINRQKIEKDGDFSGLVKGTRGYLQAAFSYTNEWNGCKKAAVFLVDENEYPVPIIQDKCDVPDEVTKKSFWELKLVGEKDGFRITTNTVGVTQK